MTQRETENQKDHISKTNRVAVVGEIKVSTEVPFSYWFCGILFQHNLWSLILADYLQLSLLSWVYIQYMHLCPTPFYKGLMEHCSTVSSYLVLLYMFLSQSRLASTFLKAISHNWSVRSIMQWQNTHFKSFVKGFKLFWCFGCAKMHYIPSENYIRHIISKV